MALLPACVASGMLNLKSEAEGKNMLVVIELIKAVMKNYSY